jgi:Fe2+ or Zn2+ uptake regulation protein
LASCARTVTGVRSPDELTVAFRRRGLKITPQRVAIFRTMHGNHHHPTADAVYADVATEMPSISLRTVYQTLNDLAEMGEIQSLDLGTGAARFDPNLDEHHHLVCDVCRAVVDVELDTAALEPTDLGGFQVARAQVIFHGRCSRCAGAAAGSTFA